MPRKSSRSGRDDIRTVASVMIPNRPSEPSLELINTGACVTIEHSILGAVRINLDVVLEDPLPIYVTDSILDATDPERDVLCGPSSQLAHAVLTIARSTVIG